jgi:hypothetical protein
MRPDPDTCRDPDLLADEVRRLRAVIDSEPTLTDLERTAIAAAADDYRYPPDPGGRAQHIERTLRGLLERLG